MTDWDKLFDIDLYEADRLDAIQAIDDLNVQCKFWRQAAEHAVEGWNKLEEKHEAVIEAIAITLGESCTQLSFAAWHRLERILNESSLAEEMPSEAQTVDLGDGKKLRVVEEEKPR